MSKLTTVSCIFLVILIASLLFVTCAKAQSSTAWSKTFDASSNDRGFSLIKTQEGGYAMLGTSMSHSITAGLVNALLIITDAEGNMLWNQTYNGMGAVYPCALIQTGDGGYVLAGYTYSLEGANPMSWFAKTDAAGNLLWNKTYSELGNIIGNIIQTSDGGYALVGCTTISNDFVQAWLTKTDADGNIQWKQDYGTSGDNELYAIIPVANDGYILGGYTTSMGAGEEDFWLIGTNSHGNMLWNQTYGDLSHNILSTLVQTSDGGYALFGFSSLDSANEDFMTVKTDASGVLEWVKTYGGLNIEEAFSGIQTTDGNYVTVGVTSTSTGIGNAWMVKTDADGNMLWNQTYGGENESVLYSIVQADDGGYVAVGYTNSSATLDFWMIKTDENGVIPEFSGIFVVALIVSCATIVAMALRKTIVKKVVPT